MKHYKLTRTALLLALCIVLGIAENSIVLFPAVPGIKLGLANVCVMFALFALNFPTALSLGVAKSLFAFITRGASAGVLSIVGGVISIVLMYIIIKISKKQASFVTVSVTGGVLHNLGQLIAVSLLWGSSAVFSLTPVLIVSGIIFGILNALLLRVTLPYLKKAGGNK